MKIKQLNESVKKFCERKMTLPNVYESYLIMFQIKKLLRYIPVMNAQVVKQSALLISQVLSGGEGEGGFQLWVFFSFLAYSKLAFLNSLMINLFSM